MNINNLKMVNFRRFENLEIDLSPSFNVLIGENGSGKSSVLDALTMGLRVYRFKMGARHSAKISDNDIRLANYETSVEYQLPTSLKFIGDLDQSHVEWCIHKEVLGDANTTKYNWNQAEQITKQMREVVQNGENNVLPIIAYFPTPRTWGTLGPLRPAKPDSRLTPYQSVPQSVIDHKTFLEWFTTKEFAAVQTNRREFHELELVRQAITTCVEGCKKFYHDFDWGYIVVEMKDGSIMPIDRLSGGLTMMLAMVGDIAYRCYNHNPHLGQKALESPGIVLIDELDLHLHPRWQKHVVNDLKHTFPNIQFIVTTHSPIILSSINGDDKVILLDDNEAQYLTHTQGRDVNDILKIYMDTEIKNQDIEDYLWLIESGQGYSEDALNLRAKIENESGADYHELAHADLLLSFYQ